MAKKRSIPSSIRVSLARRHGCEPGKSVPAKCTYCDFVGQIAWVVQPTDRGVGWVQFNGLELDHCYPEALGGDESEENIVLACRPCNRSKHIKTLDQWRSKNGPRP